MGGHPAHSDRGGAHRRLTTLGERRGVREVGEQTSKTIIGDALFFQDVLRDPERQWCTLLVGCGEAEQVQWA